MLGSHSCWLAVISIQTLTTVAHLPKTDQVYSLAAPFIKSCPKGNPTLPFKPYPAVTVKTKGPYKAGQQIEVALPKDSKGTVYAHFVDATNVSKYEDITKSGGKLTIPEGIAGQSYLILTSGPDQTDKATIAGPAIIYIPS